MTDTSNKNKGGMILLLIFLLICSCLGIAAFILHFTNKNCPENFRSTEISSSGTTSFGVAVYGRYIDNSKDSKYGQIVSYKNNKINIYKKFENGAVEKIIYSPEHTIYVAVGWKIDDNNIVVGIILHSTDGVNWKRSHINHKGENIPSVLFNHKGENIPSVLFNEKEFVAFTDGSSGKITIFKSPDGKTWTPEKPPSKTQITNTINDFSYSPEKNIYVAVLFDNKQVTSQSYILYSKNDGVTWNYLNSLPIFNRSSRIVYMNKTFFVLGQFGNNGEIPLLSSKDGIKWNNIIPITKNLKKYYKCNPDVSGYTSSAPAPAPAPPPMCTKSLSGTYENIGDCIKSCIACQKTEPVKCNKENNLGYGLAYSPKLKMFVMCGLFTSPLSGQNCGFVYSTDGIEWIKIGTDPTLFDYVRDVTWDNITKQFYATARSYILSSGTTLSLILSSHDGKNWKKEDVSPKTFGDNGSATGILSI